jgi:hypothetical protein
MWAWVRRQVGDLLGDIGGALRVALIALGGLVFSLLLDREGWPLLALTVLVGVGGAYILEAMGRLLLPDRPVAALAFMEWWALAPAMVAALATAAVLRLDVEYAPTAGDALTKAQTEAMIAALTGLISAVFIAPWGDRDNSRLAERIKSSFHAAYVRPAVDGSPPPAGRRVLPAGSAAEVALHDLNVGWDWSGRHDRASRLQAALSDLPPAG